MPLIDNGKPLQFSAPMASEHDAPDPGFFRTISDKLIRDNNIGSAGASVYYHWGVPDRIDPEYNVFQDDDPDIREATQAHPDAFDDVFNVEEARAKVVQLDAEEARNRRLAASGWGGSLTGDLLAAVLDPTMLIPGGAIVRSGKLGYSAAKTALVASAAAGVGAAVQEAGLQSTQDLRSASESMTNIGGSVILGGLLGAGAARWLSHGEFQRAGDQLVKDLTGEIADPVAASNAVVARMRSAGAAAVEEAGRATLEDLGVGGSKAAQAVARATAAARINPGVETMFSPFQATR
ncbi:hypothetical protein, partial [Breoghania sp. JC706]|uniref:hypothetical protein n=1 Tax=Breoghania sp. JC706 TaxID=3117732 RepID=UPI0030086B6A